MLRKKDKNVEVVTSPEPKKLNPPRTVFQNDSVRITRVEYHPVDLFWSSLVNRTVNTQKVCFRYTLEYREKDAHEQDHWVKEGFIPEVSTLLNKVFGE